MKRLLLLSLVALTAMSASAQDYDFVYEQYNHVKLYFKITKAATSTSTKGRGEVTLVGGTGPEGSEVFTDLVSYNGYDYTPTAIDVSAFRGATWIETLHIAYDIKSVGNFAFQACTGLKNLNIAQTAALGIGMFSSCTALTSVNIPQGITEIPEMCFSGCDNLETITIGRDVEKIDETAFSGTFDKRVIIINSDALLNQDYDYEYSLYHNLSLWESNVNIIIAEGLTSIGSFAFYDYALEKPDSLNMISYASSSLHVTFPSSLKTIGKYAFCGCPISSLKLPEGLTRIGQFAFMGCKNLSTVYMPSSLTDSGALPFDWTPMLSEVHIPKDNNVIKEIFTTYGSQHKRFNFVSIYTPDENVYNYFNGLSSYEGRVFLEGGISSSSLKEDVNEDGQVNSLDVLKVYKYMQTH